MYLFTYFFVFYFRSFIAELVVYVKQLKRCKILALLCFSFIDVITFNLTNKIESCNNIIIFTFRFFQMQLKLLIVNRITEQYLITTLMISV